MSDAISLRDVGARLGAVALLIALNAFFVAAEFALVGVRRSRIDQLAEEGDRSAQLVQRILGRLDVYISSAQLGITLASLGLGWIGEQTFALIIDAGFAALGWIAPAAATHTLAATVAAYVVLTGLHITIGEQTPKSAAIVQAETVARFVARPLLVFTTVMGPFIRVLNGANNALLRTLRLPAVTEQSHVHSPEELRMLVMQARAHGTLDESDSAMLAGVFDFHDKRAYDVMRPRTEVAALDVDATEDEVWAALRSERYSRYPVYRDTLDDVVGVFLAKDLWLRDPADARPFALADYLREAVYVPSTRAAERVLDDLRRTRAQLAVVLDEYGGTAGIVTVEDLVEEVIGDINDEYDQREREAVEFDGVLELAGTMSLVDVRSDHHLDVPEGDWTTLGGYVFSQLGRLPHVGDRAPFPGGEFEVVAMDGRRVAAVRVHRATAATTGGPTGGRANKGTQVGQGMGGER
ncbi:membrane protein [Gemmatimonadetes bacterium T265]|nr:membrane protein [Gemmatimonadetes bacterium T265]